MPTTATISDIETFARRHLLETTASFWTAVELNDITMAGVRDLWRPIADLKQEHFVKIDSTNVVLPSNTSTLRGIPQDVHKVYLIEPRDLSNTSANRNLIFLPLEYNHDIFASARSASDIDPSNDTIYYAVFGEGGPVGSVEVRVAPQTTSNVNLTFGYIPTLDDLQASSVVPIPGESTNALVAWTVAYARAKERDDRSPDPGWIAIYSTEKTNLIHSLGLRQYHKPLIADGLFDELWAFAPFLIGSFGLL